MCMGCMDGCAMLCMIVYTCVVVYYNVETYVIVSVLSMDVWMGVRCCV